MKIFDNEAVKNNMRSYLLEIGKKKQEDVSNEKDEKEVSERSDKINLSSNARELQSARQAIRDVPDIRREKIAGIERDIANNKYDVKAELVADKIIKETLMDAVL
ncbi:MAG: flagellar biosynthesis anti-sigma factor FlgM [Nitrospirota bacterium]